MKIVIVDRRKGVVGMLLRKLYGIRKVAEPPSFAKLSMSVQILLKLMSLTLILWNIAKQSF